MVSREAATEPLNGAHIHSDRHSRIALMVGEIYESAAPSTRVDVLEHLLRPLSALSVVGVAGGIFAKVWFQSGWAPLHFTPEDIGVVERHHVHALAEYIQQARPESLGELVSLLAAGSAVAVRPEQIADLRTLCLPQKPLHTPASRAPLAGDGPHRLDGREDAGVVGKP